ncbi:MAG: RHS repeat-associated core domain-containing protein, partial [Lachnospiraceae bacterium]|nr:RHS repeat-associated core domain-containing protein [Lachnospiraceae bacterium]
MSELVYDCRNRLVSAGGITYTYDAENIRIKSENADYVEEYVTDTVSASLSRVLTMTVYEKKAGVTETNGTTTTYLYGQGLISEETEGTYLYHHYNNLGSTMKLTDNEGQVVETYTYGVYGELLSGDETLTRFLYNGRCGVSTEANGLYYMRHRYYNPTIKRFINQDILTGSLDNSQSLNRYSYVQGNPVSYTDPFGLSPVNGLFTNSNFTHSILSLASCIPGFVGTAASVLDGLVYAVVDKDYSMTALCFMDALSFGLGKAGTNLLKANKLSNTAQVLITSSHLMSNAASFGMCANATMTTGFAMYDKYYIQGQSIDSNTKWEVLSLGMSVLGGVISGKGISKSTKKMSSMLQQDGFTNALKGEVLEMASGIKRSVSAIMADNRGFVDLDEL